MMKSLLVAALCLVPQLALAQTMGPKENCVQAINTSGSTSLISSDMSASRSFSIDRTEGVGGYDLLRLFIFLTDADSSITRFDLTCTVSDDGNVTSYTPQECTVAAGIATCVAGGIWQKATPATSRWSYRLDIAGWNDIKCTVSVGTGAGAAADTIVVTGKFCTE